MNAPLVLRSGGAHVSLLPHLGGAIGGFGIDGREILRPTPEHAADPLETACFPLVPYANRIAAGRFSFAGTDHSLPPNHPAFPHPLHGLGWVKSWTVAEQATDRAVLACSHRADDHWPWDWSAVQRVEVGARGLAIALELVNASARAMPAGLGLHPYFVRGADDALRFAAEGLWHNDAAMIPDRALPADALGDFAARAIPPTGSLIDNCYFGWTGAADWGEGVTLRSRGADFLHVFAPPGEHFLCLEPTSHMPDAFNRADFTDAGGSVLAPGDRLTLRLEIGVNG